MDPTTQTNAVITNDTVNTNTTVPTPPPTNNTNTVIAGAFGGTLPVPPQVSETMPAFSFDEDDFWNNEGNNTIPSHENIADPFAWGITSLTTNTTIQTPLTPTTTDVIIEDTTIPQFTSPEEVVTATTSTTQTPEWTISLDSLEKTIQWEDIIHTEVQQDTVVETTISPDISPIQEVAITTNNENIPTTTDTNNLSFDLPSESIGETTVPSFDLPPSITTQTPDAIAWETLNTESTINSEVSFDLPSDSTWDIITESQEHLSSPIDEIPEQIATNETVSDHVQETSTQETPINDSGITQNNEEDTKEEINEDIEEENTTLPQITSDTVNKEPTTPAATITESRDNTTHELQEIYDEFKKAFLGYTTFKNSTAITLTGLRTEEEEINYTFTQSNDNHIVVTKSNTSDTLSFEETESGIKASINEDTIWYYGVDQVDSDTTHYLKEKLGKFTMMLESEHEREEKRNREESKKIKDTLKNF